MNTNDSAIGCAAARFRVGLPSAGAILGIAAACLLASVSAGCHSGGGAVCHAPAFEQLEQGCFGYEPTVWRSMAADCQQAVRLVAEEVPPVQTPTPADQSAVVPPDPDATPPAVPEATLDEVPERIPLDIPRIVAPPQEDPEQDAPATKPPAVSPAEVPSVPVPEMDVEPATKQPAAKPAAEQAQPAAEETQPAAEETSHLEPAPVHIMPAMIPPQGVETAQPRLAPVISGPVARASRATFTTPDVQQKPPAAAGELFRTVSAALEKETPRAAPATRFAAEKKNGLSRFISY